MLPHGRVVECTNPELTADKRHARVPIINFSWEKAQALAVARPSQLLYQTPHARPDGTDMTDEPTTHATLREAHEWRIKYEAMEQGNAGQRPRGRGRCDHHDVHRE